MLLGFRLELSDLACKRLELILQANILLLDLWLLSVSERAMEDAERLPWSARGAALAFALEAMTVLAEVRVSWDLIGRSLL